MRLSYAGLLGLSLSLSTACISLPFISHPHAAATPAAPAAVASAAPAPQVAAGDVMPAPNWLFNDLACAPSVTVQPASTLRVLGSQDTVIKQMFGPGDTLIISGGAAAGLQPGQRYFVKRHIMTFGAKGPDPRHPVSVHVVGWVDILGVDTSVATAAIVHSCDGFLVDDYLEPFVAPVIAAHTGPGSVPQYANMGHITIGDEATQSVGSGQLMGIDRGSNLGVMLGQRYLVFRDKRTLRKETTGYSRVFEEGVAHLPLVEVGEVVVIAVRPDESTVQVVMAKDSVMTGDFIAEVR